VLGVDALEGKSPTEEEAFGSHAAYVSRPDSVAAIIKDAAHA
jgi:hypothetical protein